MALDEGLWGKSIKPLPTPPKRKVKAASYKGMVRREDYEAKQFQQAFKKGKTTSALTP